MSSETPQPTSPTLPQSASGSSSPAAANSAQGCASPRVAVLTGGADKPYALGLANTLLAREIPFDFVGSDEVNGPELHGQPLVRFLNLRGDQTPNVSVTRKVIRVLQYYGRLLGFAARTEAKIFHILWNNKLELIDRTILLLYYRLLGKRVVFTAHNVNARKRDGNDSWLNRVTLRAQYHLVHHVFVHTQQMKEELVQDFNLAEWRVSVIPFGINDTVPNTSLSGGEARGRLGLAAEDQVVLFFGNIAPYKGVEHLVEAMGQIMASHPHCRLIVAGRPKNCQDYWEGVQRRIKELDLGSRLILRSEYIPDEETEVYFKAADVLVLPYTHVFQSGVLFLAYNFGLPVVASDVGSLKEDIIEGRTGYVCRPKDSADLAARLREFFGSELYTDLAQRRADIRSVAQERHSWVEVGRITTGVYNKLV